MAAVLPVKNPEADPGQREQHEHGPFVRQIHRWLRRVGAEHKPPQTDGQGREHHEYPDHEYQRPAAATTKVGEEFHFSFCSCAADGRLRGDSHAWRISSKFMGNVFHGGG